MEHIKALKADNQNVFKRVYEQYHPQIYGFILQRTKSDYIAQEVTQLTFIKFWQQRDILSDHIQINVQLFGMARQVMIDLLRKEATRFKHEGQSAPTPFTDSLIDAIESKDLLRLMEEDIQNMPKMRRMIFELSRKKGLSHKEIAQLFSISPKTVEQHIGKALVQLKQHLYSIML
ncbi:RNA polymerase sigma-70 factor (ECF subfamily) [Sphingobacterium allocomposti]|jgi:RNA polymerase sigma-70 factor (family 1)|uniref:RNA polymerase sigma-70 factor (ECF subfamily) n=1 Tax=Sphingobacterium allocomposti TaxID=415956 RepID=A0A5S5DCE4_9SPHI|nr:sigma-70 family RNA polymerase sigma factor [Sphingobacterium composti Yoo et al. 2007 non Ten et al. 2007]TYP92289.1 RNA polymerase sigma-70 factor (ECF subfamily) [Sphingobacterium composti Yoo et al. 2007 non Ten et al. 2007]HLS94724.1 sigma-70 family RNA polymerase sigma factor [Sphingobacterium sp.]